LGLSSSSSSSKKPSKSSTVLSPRGFEGSILGKGVKEPRELMHDVMNIKEWSEDMGAYDNTTSGVYYASQPSGSFTFSAADLGTNE